MKEHQNIERKKSWRDEYLKWICGFANADGGRLVIGRNDDGEVVGAKDAAKLLEDIPNKVRNVLGILVAVNLRGRSGKEFLEIVVDPYPSPVSYKGEYHFRSGTTRQELKGAVLSRFLLRKYGRTWDAIPVPQVPVKALSKAAVDTFRKLARQSERLSPAVLREPTRRLLEKLHLMEGKYLRRAALLLFHPDPEIFFTGAFVKVGRFNATEVLYHDEIHGDLFTQVDRIMDILMTKYLIAGISYRRVHRIETFPVPEEAVREAVVNAIVHRDYAIGTPIQIRVYDDRLVIWNAGTLPHDWTVTKFEGSHPSHPYSPDIANAFFRVGHIEAWGQGISKIVDACHAAGVPKPQMRWESGGLRVEFAFPQATRQVPYKRHTSTVQATEIEARVLRSAIEPVTREVLQAAAKLKNRAHFVGALLKPLLKRGLLEMTIPDKPTISTQRYRLTALGRSVLDATEESGFTT